MPVDEITAVFTRLPCVFDQELIDIVPGDRAYVAAEMTAFLLSWLSRLTCPVLNRPTPTCLSGPYWRQERWVYAAAQIGIPVQPVQRRAVLPHDHPAEPPDDGSVTVIVVGKQCLGEVDKTLATQARRLADVAQTDLLAVRFSSAESGATFISADAWPDALAEGATDAILAYLQGGSKEGS